MASKNEGGVRPFPCPGDDEEVGWVEPSGPRERLAEGG